MATSAVTIFDLRRFGIGLAIILTVTGGFFDWTKSWPGPTCMALAAVSVLLAIAGPRFLRPLEWFWRHLGRWLGYATTYLILIATFYLMITPIGLVMRLFGKGVLKIKLTPDAVSYWETVIPDADRPDKPF